MVTPSGSINRKGFFLSHRVFHALSADEMEVHVENGLSAVDAGVVDDAEPLRVNAFAFCKHPRHGEDVPDQHFVIWAQVG